MRASSLAARSERDTFQVCFHQLSWGTEQMADRILVLYGSYRFDRMGIRLADFLVAGLRDRGNDPELIDAKLVGLPILERIYKEYTRGAEPVAMEQLAEINRADDLGVSVTGEEPC